MQNHHDPVHFDDRIDALKHRARGLADASSTRLSDVKRFIVANPLPAVAVAFGLGYLAMRIVRR